MIKEMNKITDKTTDSNIDNHAITINLVDVIKIYKRKKVETSALRSISCQFRKGEITILMGPSGCGKTTLLNIIGGISRPNGGGVLVMNQNITQYTNKEMELYRRNKVSYVFQQLNLIPTMTVADNVSFPLEYTNQWNPTSLANLKEIISFIGIENKLDHYPNELSGGEQQRAALAAALVKNTPIILCDEPTGELDSAAKMKVMELLTQIKQKFPDKTILIVTHDPDFKLIADRLLYMRDGKISYEVSKEELLAEKDSLKNASDVSYQALNQSNDEEMILELREISKIIADKLSFFKERKEQRKSLNIETE
ncbi:ABC transporter ATP-binding protein [Candidatus Lokiarchaeum ossiferum]|uniref:ABC transporter ATP-binding protein n=1 Tax=Candidatus Lokiarchaeum ossiferum TaxID=2951803 RepID=UPI00352C2FB7